MLVLKAFATLSLPLLSIATPLRVRNDPPTTCNSGDLKCCNTTTAPSSAEGSALLGLLGLGDLLGLDGLLGLNCDPLSVIGLGKNSCTQQTVCCEGNNFGPSGSSSSGFSLITIGCSPINLGL